MSPPGGPDHDSRAEVSRNALLRLLLDPEDQEDDIQNRPSSDGTNIKEKNTIKGTESSKAPPPTRVTCRLIFGVRDQRAAPSQV